MHYTTLHYTTPYCTALNYTKLQYITPHYTTRHHTTCHDTLLGFQNHNSYYNLGLLPPSQARKRGEGEMEGEEGVDMGRSG